MQRIPYARQWISDEDIDRVVAVLRSDYLTQGPVIPAFEEAFAEYVGSQYAVACSNGTAALHLSALALNVKPGQKIITTPLTFAASANCVAYCGGQIQFADIDPNTGLLALSKVEQLLEENPPGSFSGVIPVDYAGYPQDLEALHALATSHGLWVLEDACHAPGGRRQGQDGRWSSCGQGNFADLAIFSFHPVKHIAAGEGGMITTNSLELASRLRSLRSHGITREPGLLLENHGPWYYEMQELGWNYRLSDILAALGLSQLKRAGQGLQRRRILAQSYDAAFYATGIKSIRPPAEVEHAYHLYVIRTAWRDQLLEHLRQRNIHGQVHYIPVHLHPYYRQFGWKRGDFPCAEAFYDTCLSLPLYPTLQDEEQKFVIDSVLDFASCHPE